MLTTDLPRPWGTSTEAWGPGDIERFAFELGFPVRSFEQDVLTRLQRLSGPAVVEQYGPEHGNFYRVRVGTWDSSKPKILITGGVHGYETGGVDAALTFAEKYAPRLAAEFDSVVFPCINPLAYEFNIRWNDQAQDTNRHFCRNPELTESRQAAFECEAFMDSVDALGVEFILAVDCHETTNRDLELRLAKIHRDGKTGPVNPVIPQGFYLVMNKGDESSSIGPKIIEAVSRVTRIAPEPIILGVENKRGVVYLDCAPYPGLCMNYTQAPHRVTTEVYPDIISPDEALAGQLAAIHGAIEHVRSTL